MMMKTHHFFNLENSFLPLLTSMVAFNFFLSMLIFMKMMSFFFMVMSLISAMWISFFWWGAYRKEFWLKGDYSFTLGEGLKMSIILFICSEVFFFFAFFWSYFQNFFSPTMELGLAWPPYSIEMFNYSNIPLINTLVLVSSGATVTLSHFYLGESKNNAFNLFLFMTVFLGMIFSLLQMLEYQSAFFSINDSIYGTVFFVLTGFHGSHVVAGTIFLFSCLKHNYKMILSPMNFPSFEMASWYWHFVDVVWIFLYYFIYYLNSN